MLLFLISIVVVQFATELLQAAAERPRPFDVTALASWEGYACPSLPVVALALIGVAAIYMLVVPGRARMRATRPQGMRALQKESTAKSDRSAFNRKEAPVAGDISEGVNPFLRKPNS